MDPSGFNTGRASAVPLVPRQGVVFGRAAAAGKPVAGTGVSKAGAGTGVSEAGGGTGVSKAGGGTGVSKAGGGTGVSKAGGGTAGGKAVSGPLPGSGSTAGRQTLKGVRPGAQVSNPETEHNVNNRKPSPTRMRKPAPASTHPPSKQNPGGAIFSEIELQREANAKAQRLLRFSHGQEMSDVVSQPTSSRVVGKAEHRFPQRDARQPSQSQKLSVDNSQLETMETEPLGEDFSDTEAIVGTCEFMCCEIERHERERKGDLDKFERVDGDRNLTSADLAVKKYTRTPSREPHLIRPLPVLQMTMNYLLSLISQGYDEGLLRLHSFLWDRMRAVRMDLRMQHIFNLEAIIMHEQMIRFHILAMHELCEYKKGEGFNEGFDAHLNIEQMNKASVDLFEMYDDHRKKGILVETEAEFRGYYALLKLDKHPGYSVEPAELSLDLAKMTPEMRNTPQVLFARDVARACRGCNYIAFFRLARKSTYLQACLMHAHFAKLRTEALAILHSGLQKNQGIQINQVVKWLGMEGEDIEALAQYHGFSLKAFEKLYAIKDGPFLNRDAEYQARRSRLVESKRSLTIVEDVEGKGQQQVVVDSWAATPMTPGMQEEEMPDYEDDPLSPAETSQPSPALRQWTFASAHSSPGTGQGVDDIRISPHRAISPAREGQTTLSTTFFSSRTLPLWPAPHQNHLIPKSSTENLSPQRGRKRESYPGRLTQDIDLKEGYKKLVTVGGAIDVEPEEEEDDDALEPGPTSEEIRAQKVLVWEVEKEKEREIERERERRKRATEEAEAAAAKWEAKLAADAELKRQQQEEERLVAHRAEASAGKKRLWLRRWKRRAAVMAEEKLRRKIRAEAALGSLFVGAPLAGVKSAKDRAQVTLVNGGSARMTVDHVSRVRSEKIREMWKPLDIASLVLPLFEHKFPSIKFITFKLLLSVGDTDASNMAGHWLSNKLSEKQLIVPEVHADGRTPGLWFEAMNVDEEYTSYSETALHGASGLVFLVRKGHSVAMERARLHALVETLPVGVRLPLLLLYSPKESNIEAETERLKAALGLYDFEGLRIGWQNVSPVSSSNDGDLYSDGFLCGGLVWLANSSASQPNLRPIHIRELVTSNLDGHCKILMASSSSNVTPERCISIFNRSLRSAGIEIRKAVGAAPPHWPPEEALLEVNGLLPGILPKQGWNEPDLLDPIHQVLHIAELPRFPTIEQVKPGSPTSAWENVRYQKVAVERAMQRYLALVDGINEDHPVLVRQAQMIIRRNSCLEWTESGLVLVPRWANIFQAIYQNRLLLLNSEPPPIVYVVSKDEEVERALELDEVEQQIPFASEIAAGTPFGRTRHVNLMFDDTEEQEARNALQEKLSLANCYTDWMSCEDHERTTSVKQHASPEKMEEDIMQVPIQGRNTWSVFSPSLETWPGGQPVSLKKRRLSLSPESIFLSLPTSDPPLASVSSRDGVDGSDLQAPGSQGSPRVGDGKDHVGTGTFGTNRLAEELLLDTIFMKLNNDVDRVLRRASSDMCFSDTQVAAYLSSEGAVYERSQSHSDSNCSNARTGNSGVSELIEPRVPTTSGSDIGSLYDMLERCRRVQKSIDRKLEDTFGNVYDGVHNNP